jgi:DNA repair protein RecN (Recombination protein N)
VRARRWWCRASGLLFGGRADAGRVRPDAPRALVEGRLLLAADSAALSRAVDAGAELDDGALLVSRSVGADGRSRAHLGGLSVPVGVLGELAEHVLAVHGQSDQQRLLKPAQQRAALDRYAGPPVLGPRERFRADWARWRDVRATLEQLRAEAAERVREAELLRLGVAEVEGVAPTSGEDTALAAEIERLANADDLRAAAATAQVALTGDEDAPDGTDALQLLVAARRSVQSAADHDPELAGLAVRLAELAHLATDVAGDLASYLASVDADPARLGSAQERLSALTALVRRHAVADVDGVPRLGRPGLGPAAPARRHRRPDRRPRGAGRRARALPRRAGGRAVRRPCRCRAGFGEGGHRRAGRAGHAPRAGHGRGHPASGDDGLRVGDRVLAAGPDGVDEVELLLVPHPGAPAARPAEGRVRRRAVARHAGRRGRVRRVRPCPGHGLRRGRRRASAGEPPSRSADGWPGSPATTRSSS